MRKISNGKKIFILIIIVIIAVVVIAIRSCGGKINLVYDYDKVSIGSVKKTISVSGKLQLYDAYWVKSKIAGEVSRFHVDFNEKVKKGELLVSLDSEKTDDEITAYIETYKKAKLDLDSSKEYLYNKRNLYKEQLISKKELESAKMQYQKNISSFKQTQLKYRILLEKSKAKKVYSPVSGIVIQRSVELRKPVDIGTALYMIAPTLKKMKLVINIDESDIGLVKKGQSVDFSVSAYPEKIFSGVIHQVRMNPVKSGSVVTYESLVICKNNDELLRPGMTVTATVNIAKKDNVLRVPNQAFEISPVEIEVKPGKKYVWKKEKVSIKAIPMKQIEVKIGLVGDYYTEVKTVLKDKLKKDDEILVGIHKKMEVKDELSSYGK